MKKLFNIFNWLAAIILSFIYSTLIIISISFVSTIKNTTQRFMIKIEWLPLGLLFLLFFGIWIILNLLLNKFKFDKNNFFRIILIIFIACPLFLFAYDISPVENDYTWENVITPKKDAIESFNTFNKFAEIKIDCSFTNIPSTEINTNILAYTDIIEKSWKNNIKAHQLIKKLNSFDKIADFTINLNDDYIRRTTSFFYTLKLYSIFAKLKIEQKNFVAATDSLLAINSIFQKSYPYSRTLVQRLFWMTSDEKIISNINSILTNKNCTAKTIQRFKDSVIIADLNFESCVISEYLLFKNLFEIGFKPALDKPNFINVILLKIGTKFLIDKNRTLKDAKKSTDIYISCLTNKPANFTNYNKYIKSYRSKPQLKNPAGWILNGMNSGILYMINEKLQEKYKKRKALVEKLKKM